VRQNLCESDILFLANIFMYIFIFKRYCLLLTQYCSGDKIEENEMGGACSVYGERRDACRVLVGKPEGKRPLGRLVHRW
jgi:hypothetical protein